MKHKKIKRLNDMSLGGNVAALIILGLLAALCIFPMLLVISTSFSTESLVRNLGFSIIPRGASLNAYKFLFRDAITVVRSAGISVLITVVGSIVSLLIIALYAYPISRKDFRYRKLFAFLVFFTLLFNGGLVPWYMVYTNMLNIKNTIWVMIIPSLFTPFYVLIMRSFFVTSIPDSLIESANIDGANEIVIFTKIVIPLSKPGLATIGLFNAIMYWNDWFKALLFVTDQKLAPLQYLLYKMQISIQVLKDMAQRGMMTSQEIINVPDLTARMAMCVLVILPILFAYPFFQKYFISGLTLGAIKG